MLPLLIFLLSSNLGIFCLVQLHLHPSPSHQGFPILEETKNISKVDARIQQDLTENKTHLWYVIRFMSYTDNYILNIIAKIHSQLKQLAR